MHYKVLFVVLALTAVLVGETRSQEIIDSQMTDSMTQLSDKIARQQIENIGMLKNMMNELKNKANDITVMVKDAINKVQQFGKNQKQRADDLQPQIKERLFRIRDIWYDFARMFQ